MELHETADWCDAAPVILVERRRLPDRRASWRGGRRDADWFNRPIGAWRQVEHRQSPWREWLSKLPQYLSGH